MRDLYAAGHEKFGERWVGMASVAALVTNTDGKNNEVSDFWNGMETVKDRKDFGRDLNTYKGRWLSGVRMLVDSPSKRICRARIMFTKDASSDPGGKRADSSTNKTNGDSVQKTRLSDLQARCTTSPDPDNVVNLVKVVTFSDRKSSDDVNKNSQKQNEILSREFSTPKRNLFNHFNHITNLDGLTEALTHLVNGAEDSPLYLDIETTGLDPRKSTIRLLTLSAGDGKVFIIDLDRVYFPDRLKTLLEHRTIVGQNLLFDSAFLKHHFKVNITKTWDTMIAGRLLSAGVMEEVDGTPRPLKNDLSSLLKRYCGTELGEDLSKSDWSQPELTDAQLKYAAEDITFLPQLKKALEEAIEKEFDAPSGKVTLADLFAGRNQLVIYHFMFGPDWQEGCPSCSFVSDHIDGALPHLAARDVTMVTVSRAPLAKIEAFKKRMGWRFNWVSSYGGDFNADFYVSFTKEEIAQGKVNYNYTMQEFPSAEAPGLSVFYKDAAGGVFHTYSTYGRGVELLMGTYRILDLVPKGRDEGHLRFPMEWVRYHDRYGTHEFADADKPYRPETESPSSVSCGCGSAEARA